MLYFRSKISANLSEQAYENRTQGGLWADVFSLIEANQLEYNEFKISQYLSRNISLDSPLFINLSEYFINDGIDIATVSFLAIWINDLTPDKPFNKHRFTIAINDTPIGDFTQFLISNCKNMGNDIFIQVNEGADNALLHVLVGINSKNKK